ncbi:alkaline phosphatase family protein [Micrococcales bacterium 31B]|nr:alkaline phosphatase family protein [Micrococcales bacterium 31B]
MSEVAAAPQHVPAYGVGTLADVLPSVATQVLRAHGLDAAAHGFAAPLAALDGFAPRSACVVLVDGLGLDLLRGAGGYAPFLRRALADEGAALTAGFPTTTSTSMGSFGTGQPPGGHGLLGYTTLVPEHDAVMNLLTWDARVDPLAFQPTATVFERLERAGLRTAMVGPGRFDGSGLTLAALRGGRFLAAEELGNRVRRAAKALRDRHRDLVYLYWGDIDMIGHQVGCGSQQWAEELQFFDRAMQRLRAQLPRDCLLVITSDHGMVDAPLDTAFDLALAPHLLDDVRHRAGEPRVAQLYVRPGAERDVAAAWAEALGERAWVRTRAEAVASGWFGPVSPEFAPRIGDVIVACRGTTVVVDTKVDAPRSLAMVGQHGSLSPAELNIPLIRVLGEGGK